uniref:Uncharacterized protein n=1 Tax=Anopheles culicifacies TaxID=139723 RepID=A0A182MX16_9DIPT
MPYLISSEQPPQVHLLLCLLRIIRSHWQVVSSPFVQKRVIVHAREAELIALSYDFPDGSGLDRAVSQQCATSYHRQTRYSTVAAEAAVAAFASVGHGRPPDGTWSVVVGNQTNEQPPLAEPWLVADRSMVGAGGLVDGFVR